MATATHLLYITVLGMIKHIQHTLSLPTETVLTGGHYDEYFRQFAAATDATSIKHWTLLQRLSYLTTIPDTPADVAYYAACRFYKKDPIQPDNNQTTSTSIATPRQPTNQPPLVSVNTDKLPVGNVILSDNVFGEGNSLHNRLQTMNKLVKEHLQISTSSIVPLTLQQYVT